ncbi:MAG: PilW family protein [Burkholderiales bacterium]
MATPIINARPRGFSIVELMVAMVIALLGTIVIFQVFAVSEGIKRTTTSGGDAQQNGLLAIYSIERHAKQAGFGLNFPQMLGCNVVAHDIGPPARDFDFRLVSAQIGDAAANAPDSVTFVFGSSNVLLGPAKFFSAAALTSTAFSLDSRFGFNLGDLILAAEVGSAKNCAMRQATGLPVAPGNDVAHVSGTFVDAIGATLPARYNKPAGLSVAYTTWDNTAQTGGRLFSLGAAPGVVTYSIANGQLQMQNFIASPNQDVIADNIVQMQAEYGRDTTGIADGTVDIWDNAAPTWDDVAELWNTPAFADDWSRVLAIRVAVVARSALAERPNPATGLCETTTVEPTWSRGVLTVSGDPSWQCYRYKVYETVVPLRNQIWMQP